LTAEPPALDTHSKMGNHKLLNNQMVQRPLQQIIDGVSLA
jgi:hypothetical protein